MKNWHAILFGVIALLVFLSIFAYLKYSEQNINPTDYITGLASVSIVFLTAAYVFITSRQLVAMKNQLNEIKKSRVHTSQPMAYTIPKKITVEKPKLYYTPPEDIYTGGSRLSVDCVVSNPGNATAISVNICSCVLLHQENEISCGALRSTMEFIDILSMTESEDNDSIPIHFLFTDRSGDLFNSLRSRQPDMIPIVRICAVYRNMLGACFACRQGFQLFYDQYGQDEIFENWQCQIAGFSSMLKNEIEEMRKIRTNNPESWRSIFDRSQKKYLEGLKGENQKLEAVQIPQFFVASLIKESTYMNMLSKSSYGMRVYEDQECFIAQKN